MILYHCFFIKYVIIFTRSVEGECMKLIAMKCPNCHANVEVDDSKQEFTCNYCRMTTKIDDEVIKVEHTIIDNSFEEKLKVANTYLFEFKEYNEAYKKFQQISDEYSYVPEIWWRLIQCLTENFTLEIRYSSVDIVSARIYKCEKYFDRYIVLEKDDEKKKENSKKYHVYMEPLLRKKKIYNTLSFLSMVFKIASIILIFVSFFIIISFV